MYKYVYIYSGILEISTCITIWSSSARYFRSKMWNFAWLFQAFPEVYGELLGELFSGKALKFLGRC